MKKKLILTSIFTIIILVIAYHVYANSIDENKEIVNKSNELHLKPVTDDNLILEYWMFDEKIWEIRNDSTVIDSIK